MSCPFPFPLILWIKEHQGVRCDFRAVYSFSLMPRVGWKTADARFIAWPFEEDTPSCIWTRTQALPPPIHTQSQNEVPGQPLPKYLSSPQHQGSNYCSFYNLDYLWEIYSEKFQSIFNTKGHITNSIFLFIITTENHQSRNIGYRSQSCHFCRLWLR